MLLKLIALMFPRGYKNLDDFYFITFE